MSDYKPHTIICRTFYIDVGKMSPQKMKEYIDNLKADLHGKSNEKIESDLADRVTFMDYYISVRIEESEQYRGSRLEIQSIPI